MISFSIEGFAIEIGILEKYEKGCVWISIACSLGRAKASEVERANTKEKRELNIVFIAILIS